MPEVKTTILKPGEGAVASMGNTFSPLIPFECLFDTDVGLIELIKAQYRNGGIFDLTKIDILCSERTNLIYYLYTRSEVNPLVKLMNNPDLEIAIDLYSQFKEKEYGNMIENGVFTGLFKLCTMFSSTPEIHPYIYYRNDYELEFLNKFKNDLKGIQFVNQKYVNENVEEFNQFYVKNVNDSYINGLSSRLDHKTVYVLDYGFNFQPAEDDPGMVELKNSPAIIELDMNRNHVNIITAYDINKLRKE